MDNEKTLMPTHCSLMNIVHSECASLEQSVKKQVLDMASADSTKTISFMLSCEVRQNNTATDNFGHHKKIAFAKIVRLRRSSRHQSTISYRVQKFYATINDQDRPYASIPQLVETLTRIHKTSLDDVFQIKQPVALQLSEYYDKMPQTIDDLIGRDLQIAQAIEQAHCLYEFAPGTFGLKDGELTVSTGTSIPDDMVFVFCLDSLHCSESLQISDYDINGHKIESKTTCVCRVNLCLIRF